MISRRAHIVPKASSKPDENKEKLTPFTKNPVAATLDRMVKPDSGYEMVLFPFTRKVQSPPNVDLASSELDSQRSEELRKLAASQLTNIDVPERSRRKILGIVLLSITAVVDIWLVVEKAGFWSRFATTPLLAFGLAYFASGQAGICNIAQSGMWQVDGKGLSKIQDQDLADRLLQKVNRFNLTLIVGSLAIALIFSSIQL